MIFLLFLLFIVAESTESVDSQVINNNQAIPNPSPNLSPNLNLNDGSSQPPPNETDGVTSVSPAAKKDCEYFPEIVLVQDISSSYKDDLQQLTTQVPNLLDYLTIKFKGFAKLGVASFTDKPVGNLGGVHDYCTGIHLPLTLMNTVSATQQIQQVFSSLVAAGGKDYIEGGNEALFRVSASNRFGWSTETHDKSSGRPIARILILSTDAPVHDPGHYESKSLPAHDLRSPENREILHKNLNHRCALTDYPTPEDIRHVMQERNIIPVVFVGDFTYASNSGTKKHYNPYKQIIQRYQNISKPWEDLEEGAVKYYEWYMKEQVGIEAVVKRIDSNSSTFVDLFQDAMDQVTERFCATVEEKESNHGGVGGAVSLVVSGIFMIVAVTNLIVWKIVGKKDEFREFFLDDEKNDVHDKNSDSSSFASDDSPSEQNDLAMLACDVFIP